jgi:ATP-binding cassette subfamily B protein
VSDGLAAVQERARAARFYDAGQGAVRIDGRDVRTLDLGGYRRRLGRVPQEPYPSAGTVAEAIAYGRPDATAAEVEAAARAVGAHDAIVALPGPVRRSWPGRSHGCPAGGRRMRSAPAHHRRPC